MPNEVYYKEAKQWTPI